MPNTGKPSQDCHLCRRRRVKCDLHRPQCARCLKYGVACPGYRDQQDLVFRHASAGTIERRREQAQARRQGAKKGPGLGDGSVSTSLSLSLSHWASSLHHGQDLARDRCHDHKLARDPAPQRQQRQEDQWQQLDGLVLGRSLVEHWKNQSIPILLNIYDLPFLHGVFAAHGPDGPLLWAAHLFSRTYVVNVRNPTAASASSRRDTQEELAGYLGKTLRRVRALLDTQEGAERDDVLATVWILAGYELLVGTQSAMRNRRNTWHLHTKGLYSILQSRGPEHICTRGGRMAFWPAMTLIQTEALVTGSECPPETDAWLDVIEHSLIPGEGLALGIARFVQAFSAAQHEMLSILYGRDQAAAAATFPRLLAGMASARARFATAYAANPERHAEDLCLVNLARSACVKGFHIVHLLANFLTHPPASRMVTGADTGMGMGMGMGMAELLRARAWCLAQVRDEARLILDSIPQALSLSTWAGGRGSNAGHKVVFDALKLMWPLIAVYTIPTTGQESRLRARAVLDFVGREVGVRQALGVREVLNLQEGEETLPPEAERPHEGCGLALGDGPVDLGYSGVMMRADDSRIDF